MAWRCKDRGFEGSRASADMSPFIQMGLLREPELYEEPLGKRFNSPGKGICAHSLVQPEASGMFKVMMPVLMALSW